MYICKWHIIFKNKKFTDSYNFFNYFTSCIQIIFASSKLYLKINKYNSYNLLNYFLSVQNVGKLPDLHISFTTFPTT
ncbi:hypothetical protein HanIR_Chr17g0885601 [Helianthus annuus]|nr:hypothetical protein HanIR_Chr17g0885601 [Helianthus annuus]